MQSNENIDNQVSPEIDETSKSMETTEVKETKDVTEATDVKENREPRENRGGRDNRDNKESKDNKEANREPISPDEQVIGVKVDNNRKMYLYLTGKKQVSRGQRVIVETARGVEIATVVMSPRRYEKRDRDLKRILRVATEADIKRDEKNREKEAHAFEIGLEKIAQYGLEMKLVRTEYTFDNNKLLFYFTADGRVDFRELVKGLASVFHTRIELRQIGVRDECRMLGGLGVCGRELCCKSYLPDFAPVSIKMAKDQGIPLNPLKISGVCGRLMCCLKNEQETYNYLNSRLPNPGDEVTTPEGLKGKVHSVSTLRQQVRVIVETDKDEKEIREYEATDLKFAKPKQRRRDKRLDISEEEANKLEEIEKLERKTLYEERDD
jgi:cell fate regulator YaaT (PSP1 superfamily)